MLTITSRSELYRIAGFETRPSRIVDSEGRSEPRDERSDCKENHWSFIIWLAGLVNVTAMLPQLARIIRTRNIEGLSLVMFVLYFLVQVAFSIEGFFKKNRMLMVCMGLSAVVSGTIILLVAYLRHFGG
jgi:uncharacterized protein with PQ loop repeat